MYFATYHMSIRYVERTVGGKRQELHPRLSPESLDPNLPNLKATEKIFRTLVINYQESYSLKLFYSSNCNQSDKSEVKLV